MKTTTLIFCLAIGAVIFGCEGPGVSPSPWICIEPTTGFQEGPISTRLATLAGTEWVLTEYENNDLPVDLRNRVTIKFSDEFVNGVLKATGRSFINSYSGDFKVDDDKRIVTPVNGIIATEMGGSQQDMSAELFYLQKLSTLTTIRIGENNRLELQSSDLKGHEIAYFIKK